MLITVFFADRREYITEEFILNTNSHFTKKARPVLKFAQTL